jgi:geranylgeranyl reductase family protein
MHDVVIIGAGPAGSAAGHYLAKQGLDVLLLDKFDFPRDKTCGDALLPRALGVLAEMDILDDLLRLGCRTSGLKIFAPRGHSTVTPIPRQKEWPSHTLVVPRLTLDHIILERAVASGAKFQSPIHITDIEQDVNGVVVKGGRRSRSVSVKARLAIVATGASPKLLLRLGLLKQTPPLMLAARAYFEGVSGLNNHLDLHFEEVPLPGYGWVFPLPDSVANIGAGFLPKGQHGPATPAAAFEHFIQIPTLKEMLARAKQVGPVKGYPLRADFATAPTFTERVIVVGEAAGLVNPLTGEGIDYALESGKIAAEHLAGMFAAGDLSRQRLGEYDRLLRQRFQRLFVTCNWMRDLFMNRPMLNHLVRVSHRQADLKLLLINLILGNQNSSSGVSGKTVLKTLLTLASGFR